MRTATLFACALAIACLVQGTVARADAVQSDWIGTYAMNHDGHVGTLRINGQLGIDYVDANGVRSTGSMQTIDDHGQHMRFTLAFGNYNQPFDAWIFSWNKNYMAGTTVWGNRRFGFLAAKGGAQMGGTKSLNPDGSVSGGAASAAAGPSDGIGSHSSGITTVVDSPPDPPGDSQLAAWLEFQNQNLLTILSLVVPDRQAVNNFVAQDPAQPFDKASRRIRALKLLLAP